MNNTDEHGISRTILSLLSAAFLAFAAIMPLPAAASPADSEIPYETMDDSTQTAQSGEVSKDGDAVSYRFAPSTTQDDFPEECPVEPIEPIYIDDRQDPDLVDSSQALYTEASQTDPRLQVVSTASLPYSAICKLTMMFIDSNDQEHFYVGTGYVIGPHTILTCGHCIYDVEHKLGWVQKIKIEPGRSGSMDPFGQLATEDVESIVVDEKWLQDASESDDNALIVLKEDISQKTGSIPLAVAQNVTSVHVSGYPAYFDGKSNDGIQYESWGSDVNIANRRIECAAYGSGGQSGSPFLDAQGRAIGTFAYVYVFQTRSGGPVMDCERLDWISRHSKITSPVYRLYNPNSGEHFYTTSLEEQKHLVSVGWNAEGLAWRESEDDDAIPVLRLYNPNAGDHHYTTDRHEYEVLATKGWRQEGEAWKAAAEKYYHPVYRLYNPNAKAGAHHFTIDEMERDFLESAGWRNENVAFYAE